MRIASIVAAVAVICLAALVAQAAPAATQPEGCAVLDLELGSFRAFLAWKTPVLISVNGQTSPLLQARKKDQKDSDRQPAPVRQSAPPPANWAAAEFDDAAAGWSRLRGPALVNTWGSGSCCGPCDPYTPGNPTEWNLVCLRGKFIVTDPAAVRDRDLAIRVRYHGGVVIYVNGAELSRNHLPQGKLDPATLAERYPDDAYLRADGMLYKEEDGRTMADRMKARVREVADLKIPLAMLRKGVNVIAIESHAAPMDERAVGGGETGWRGQFIAWPHAGVVAASLTSASGAGLVGNVGPGPDVAIANSEPPESLQTWDYAHPSSGGIAPIRITAARNGTFSGKVVLSSAAAITGLTASVDPLAQRGGAGKIPADAVRVRLAEAVAPAVSWNRPERFDRLLDTFPAEIAAAKVTIRGRKVQPPAVAVAPIWVTVRVPADTPAGEYRGTLNIQAASPQAKFAVPIELKVHDWRLPDPKDFTVRHNIYQSPDTIAQYYKVPLWSDRHFELIGQSIDALAQVGSKICVANLIARTHTLNNSESMVRWVRKADGGFDYDFAVLEKYLDLHAARAGKPAILQLNIWGHKAQEEKVTTIPQAVTVVDASGKVETMPQPPYGTPENEAFWKPVLTELRKRLEKRGWFDVTAVCYTSYCWQPSKEVVEVFKNTWPDGRWMNCSHSNPTAYSGKTGSMPVPFSEWVWGCGGLYNPETAKSPAAYPRPWKRLAARIEVGNPRFGVGFIYGLYDWSTLSAYRMVTEAATQGNLHGIGRVGGDFWPLPLGKAGQLAPLCDAYGAVGPSNNVKSLTTPGPNGAVFNERMEMFREGVQMAEAIIFLQRALESKQADGELARRIESLLDERARCYLRARPNQECNWASLESGGWRGRDDQLFALAAELAAGSKP